MVDVSNEVQQLFDCDNCKKTFRVKFPYNDSLQDLTNENLVEDSVSFTESICSRDTFKFGVLESPTIEFETVDFPNIKGETIECSLTVEGHEDEPISYGTFIVDTCERQTELNHRKVTAYGVNVSNAMSSPNEEYIHMLPSLNNTKYTYDPIKRALTFFSNYSDDFWGEEEVYKGETSDMGNSWEIIGFGSSGNRYIEYANYRDPNTNEWYRETLEIGVQLEGWEVPNNSEDVLLTAKFNVASDELINEIYDELLSGLQTHGSGCTQLSKDAKEWIKYICKAGFIYSSALADYWTVTRDGVPIINGNVSVLFNGTIKRNFYLKTDSTVGNLKQYLGAFKKIRIRCYRQYWNINWGSRVLLYTYEKDLNTQHTTINSISNFLFNLYQKSQSRYKKTNALAYNTIFLLNRSDSFSDPEFVYSFLNGFFELNGLVIGTAASGVNNINKFTLEDHLLYPHSAGTRQTVYPSNDLYFTERSLHPYQTKEINYQDTDKYHEIVYLIANYTLGSDNTEENIHYEKIIREGEEEFVDGEIYDISENAILMLGLPNTQTIKDKITEALDNLANECKKIRYRPIDITVRGMPYLEVGDIISVSTVDETFKTIILRQTIKGINILDQSIEASGGDY